MKVSIILPVYNVERYVEQCIKSVLAQTFRDFEIIIVDDCGTDRSMNIVRQTLTEAAWPEERLQIIRHPRNMGTGTARKTGILAARSEYIQFVDSDDYLAPFMTERLVSMADRHGADIAMCGFVDERQPQNGTDFTAVHSEEEEHEVDPKECMKHVLWQHHFGHVVLWNKLFRSDLLQKHNIYSTEGIYMYEDVSITYRAFYFAKRVTTCPDRLYFYRNNNNSTSHRRKKDDLKMASGYYAFIREMQLFFTDNHITDPVLNDAMLGCTTVLLGYLTLYSDLALLDRNRRLFKDVGWRQITDKRGKRLWRANLTLLSWRYHLRPLLWILRKLVRMRNR